MIMNLAIPVSPHTRDTLLAQPADCGSGCEAAIPAPDAPQHRVMASHPNPLPMPSPQSSDGTTSHSASPSKYDGQAAGYPASGRGGEREKQLLIPAGEGANESLRESYVNELMQLAQPFVFRKYLDFGAIDSMRKLHAQIRQEVQRRDLLNNIKLGPGGIREIEFTAQVFQLIRGGRDAQLRIRPTQATLQQLARNGQLPEAVVAELDAAYVFLRNLEHRLQYLDDQQTQIGRAHV